MPLRTAHSNDSPGVGVLILVHRLWCIQINLNQRRLPEKEQDGNNGVERERQKSAANKLH